MNQLDREFITNTIEKNNISLKSELIGAIKVSEENMKKFVVEHVSEEINGLAYIVSKGFEKVDQRFEDLEENMNAKFEEVHRRIDAIDYHTTKIEAFNKLEQRVTKLEKAADLA